MQFFDNPIVVAAIKFDKRNSETIDVQLYGAK